MLQILRCDATSPDPGRLQERKNNADARVGWLRAVLPAAGALTCTYCAARDFTSLSDKFKHVTFFVLQMLVFHLETHPNYTCYTQCITFNFFPSHLHEISYNLFGMLIMYWFPLIVIFYTYSSIFMEICRRSKEKNEGTADLSRELRIIHT